MGKFGLGGWYRKEKKMNTSKETSKVLAAILNVQHSVLGVKKKSENPYFTSKYADFNTVMNALRQPLIDNKLQILQPLGFIEGTPVIETIITHESGEFISSTAPILCKKKDDPQAFGSGVTYTKRYSIVSLFVLPAVDDDGNKGAAPPTSGKQRMTMEYFEKTKGNLKKYANANDAKVAILSKFTYEPDVQEAIEKFDGYGTGQ